MTSQPKQNRKQPDSSSETISSNLQTFNADLSELRREREQLVKDFRKFLAVEETENLRKSIRGHD